VLYLVLGLAICGPLLYFGAWIAVAASRTNNLSEAFRFDGTRLEAAGLIAAVISVGFVGAIALAMGAWQIIRGTRNTALVKLAGILYMLFCLAYGIIWLWS
jgi:hypothetical protein